VGLADRDWYREALRDVESGAKGPPGRGRTYRSGSLHPLLVVALAVLGVVLVYAIGVSFVEWRTQRAFEQLRRAAQQMERDAQVRSEDIRRSAAERQQQREADARAREADRLRVIAERDAAADASRRLANEQAARKERAWAKFYKQPAHCEQAATVECANGFIRAKRAFEAKYARGEL
jgi:hypothetical protein